MFDVFFLSFNEPNADAHFERLKTFAPNARRVHGVKGIHAAHQECARMASTDRFFTVDADNWIMDGFSFDLDFEPDEQSVYVWRCRNGVNGLIYGYGAIKLFPTGGVRAMATNTVDMTTSVSLSYRIVHQIASETRFNTSPFEAWKSGFREAVKLSSGIIDRQKDEETLTRLDAWCAKGASALHGDMCIDGARMGRSYGTRHARDREALAKINDFDWLAMLYEVRCSFDAVPVSEPVRADNAAGVLRLWETVAPSPLAKNLRQAVTRFPQANWNDALSWGQLQSKMWLIDELAKLDVDLGLTYVLGGWYGTLPALMFNDGRLELGKVRSFDIDPVCATIAETLNRDPFVKEDWRFKASTDDMLKLDYSDCSYTTLRADGTPVVMRELPTTLINTSCDHIAPFEAWWDRIPKDMLVILQNNNFFGADEDHVNNVESLAAMARQSPMSAVLYEGELRLPEYTRFMRIGFR